VRYQYDRGQRRRATRLTRSIAAPLLAPSILAAPLLTPSIMGLVATNRTIRAANLMINESGGHV
jgi:hypothetical protein